MAGLTDLTAQMESVACILLYVHDVQRLMKTRFNFEIQMMKLNARIGAVTIRISGKHGGIYMRK